jgi:hypothetical protein
MSATRNPSEVEILKCCTEFQIHVSHNPLFQGKHKRRILDFTEFKLRRYLKGLSGMRRVTVNAMLHDYIRGLVAIAWKSGESGAEPVGMRITKG